MARKKIDEHTLEVLEFDQVLKVLASFASSGLGKDAAMALYPSLDIDWIVDRLAETTGLRHLLDQGIRVPLAGLRDIRTLLEQFGTKQTVFEPGQLLEISDTLAASKNLKVFLDELDPEDFVHLRRMARNLGDFSHIVDEVKRCIESNESVKDEASERLTEIRGQIVHLTRQIRKEFAAIIARDQMRNALENDRFMMRHGRPVVAVKMNYRHCLRGIVLDRSRSGATLFVEPDELIEPSNELEEATYEEKKEIDRILWRLTKSIVTERKVILQSVKALSRIDLTYAKARFAIEYNMAAPQLDRDCCLKLRQARHPLLLRWVSKQRSCKVDEVMDEVVPIDVRLGDDFDLLLVTGPNAGGKTVMLKTIGLLALMTQSGMHIPASPDSTVPVYRQIYADIGDEQSIQQNLSTFSAHMRQIVRILNRADNGTLILLDEIGAGTDPTEGAVLAVAMLDKMLAKGGKVIATTHLGQLKAYAYSTARTQNASVQFDSETLAPTYRLLMGTPGSSNALAIARRMGLPKRIIGKAKSLLKREADGSTELINQVQMTREAAERNRQETRQALDEAKCLQKKASEELSQVRAEGRRLKNQADEAIDESMRQVRRLLDDFAAQMQNAPKAWKDKTGEFAEKVSAVAQSMPLAVRHAKFTECLKKGDTVYVIPFKCEAIVGRIRRKRKKVVVFVEGKQLQISFDDICRPTGMK
ncbi:MAG: endonuclease MutS2 [Planctomycetota bacterium]|jgi:DNA mismatch repair protein MutS2